MKSDMSSTLEHAAVQPLPAPRRFMQFRTIALGSIIALSFLWSILLCIAIFAQWGTMDNVEHTLIVIMLFVEFITLIMVPILLTIEFRPWLDAARCLFLFAAHFGVAVWFACKGVSFQCLSDVPDQLAICGLLTLFIMIASWIIPALVVGYSCGLSYFVYRLSKLPPLPPVPVVLHVEKQQKNLSHDSFVSASKFSHVSYGIAV